MLCVSGCVIICCLHQKQVATHNFDSLVVCRPLHITTHHNDSQKVISSKQQFHYFCQRISLKMIIKVVIMVGGVDTEAGKLVQQAKLL